MTGSCIQLSRPESPEFSRNREALQQQCAELRSLIERIKMGGGEKYCQRHQQRGKLLARDRINELLDKGSPFSGIVTTGGLPGVWQ